MPLYPSGAVGNATESPWSKLVGEMYRLYTLEVPEHEHAEFCFHLQTSGSPELEWWCNGRNGVEALAPGALMLLPPGTNATLIKSGGYAKRQTVLSVNSLA
jgi:AraC family transcriptional regulator